MYKKVEQPGTNRILRFFHFVPFLFSFRDLFTSDSVSEATQVTWVCPDNAEKRFTFEYISNRRFEAVMANFRSDVIAFLGFWNIGMDIGK